MNLAVLENTLPATAPESLEQIRGIEEKMRQLPQIQIQTEHALHAGMYARTVRLEPGNAIVGVLIKIPTILIVNGRCEVFAGDRWHRISDYQVIPAQAGRKQVFVAIGQTEITMIFTTNAQTIEEAEDEFTDEADKLLSRKQEGKCQE